MLRQLCRLLAALATLSGLALSGAGSASASGGESFGDQTRITDASSSRSLSSPQKPWEYCYPFNIC